MKHLKQLLNKPLDKVSSRVAIFVLVVSFLGFIDSSYLAIKHFEGVIPPCSITGGCEEVLTSVYSKILGIPVSLLGSIYYLLIMVGSFAFLESKKHSLLKWSLLLTIPGFIASLWFVFIQVFTLGSYCIYCLGSFLSTTVLFVIAMEVFSQHHRIISNE